MLRVSREEYKKLIAQQGIGKRKYRNTKVYVYEGDIAVTNKIEGQKPVMTFDSKKEYDRWQELQMLEKAHEIESLKRQVKILVREGGNYHGEMIRPTYYVADFSYYKNGVRHIEDVKPFDKKSGRYRTTKEFDLKWKYLKLLHNDYEFVLY